MSKVHEVHDAGWRRLAVEHGAKTKHAIAYGCSAPQLDQHEHGTRHCDFAACVTCHLEWSSGVSLHRGKGMGPRGV
jgi:hypothetical protein